MDLGSFIEWGLSHLNYWVLTLLMILENSVVPLPAELIVTPAAYKAANGEMNLYMVMFCTTFGSVVGALINYYIAKTVGRLVVYKFADSRLGHLCALDKEKMEYVEKLFLKHGKLSTFFGRLLPAGRQFISIPAGLAQMKLSSFVLYTTLGSAIWNGVLVVAGYVLAEVYPEKQLIIVLKQYSFEVSLFFVGIIVVFVVMKMIWKRIKAAKTFSFLLL